MTATIPCFGNAFKACLPGFASFITNNLIRCCRVFHAAARYLLKSAGFRVVQGRHTGPGRVDSMKDLAERDWDISETVFFDLEYFSH